MGLLLKVLSGPHLGAELLLEKGEYIIGSEGDCDICLSGVLMAGKHVKLKVDQGAVRALPLAESVYLKGQWIGEETPLDLYTVLTLGSTHLVVGQSDANWPPITPPKIEQMKGRPAHKPLGKLPLSKLLRYTAYTAAALGLTILLLLLWFVLGPMDGGGSIETKGSEDSPMAIEQTLKDRGVLSNVVSLKTGEKTVLKVFVLQEGEKLRAEELANTLVKKETVEVLAVPSILREASQSLKDLNLKAVLKWEAPAMVLLTFIGKDTTWDEKTLRGQLKLPSGLSLKIQTVSEGDFVKKARLFFKDKGFGNLKLSFQKHTFILAGQLSEKNRGSFEKVLRNFQSQYPNLKAVSSLDFVPEVGNSKDFEALFNASLSSTHLALNPALSWIGIGNGRRLFVGSEILDGWILTAIQSDYFVIEKDGKKLFFKPLNISTHGK